MQGHSYPQAWYEDAIGALLAEVGGVDDFTITEAVRLYSHHLHDVTGYWGTCARRCLRTS